MGLLADGIGIGGRCWSLAGLCALMLVACAARADGDVVVDAKAADARGVAVDSAGDVFIAAAVFDSNSGQVVKDTSDGWGGYTRSVVEGDLDYAPEGVAVDGSGDVFVADTRNSRVVEYQPDGTESLVDSNLSTPAGVAVDRFGDVFVALYHSVVEYTPTGSGGFTQRVVSVKLQGPEAVAVDRSGDVFIADTYNGRVLEERPNRLGGFAQRVVSSGTSHPHGVAVDRSGDVFIVDEGQVWEEKPDGSGGFTNSLADGDVGEATGVAVDGFGDLFIAEPFRVMAHPAAPHVVSAASLSGTPTDGQTLKVNFKFSSLFVPLGYVYQWERCSDQAMSQKCVAVGGNSRSYELSGADVGKYVTATVTATDPDSQSTSSTSAADGPIVPRPPVLVSAAEITGPTQDGQDVRVGYQFSSPDRLTYRYQWQRCSDFAMSESCVEVGGDHPYYKLTSVDVRRYLAVMVTATDQVGQSTGSVSQVVGPVAPPDTPALIPQPVITGTAQAGHSLAAGGYRFLSPDTLSYRFQWVRCSDQAMSQNCVAVGSNSHAYELSRADVGEYVVATVTAIDQENQSTSATSAAVGPISS